MPKNDHADALDWARAAASRLEAEQRAAADRAAAALAAIPLPASAPAAIATAAAEAAERTADLHDAALRRSRRRALTARDAFVRFSRREGLTRAPRTQRSLWRALVLIPIVVGGSALGACALLAPPGQSLRAGAIAAIAASATSVALGLAAGHFGLRRLEMRRRIERRRGAIAFALALVGAAVAALLFAQGLEPPRLIGLVLIMGGGWAFAAVHGHSGFDDPYPGYGALGRSFERAAAEAAHALARARADLSAIENRARADLDAGRNQLRDALDRRRAVYSAASRDIAARASQLRALTGAEPAAFDALAKLRATMADDDALAARRRRDRVEAAAAIAAALEAAAKRLDI